ncbi:DarT ssDNA thymidine ADP-ribosyltransferase family protein [Nostoc sp. UHCC 0252]|uniref:DarT ssDNA thymidine ADP-ribosyltransferase family protein n=1 Tax=Nostoc sp. UHCC 0252 TaxID=3110241 RepID=UPI002B218439|nr:DarT ssDNA thymidine ADP-ribosyltransferase family protein [Nostoc sp. UHCC 0252]MEA5604655.1 DarT ssDNA thymidine ADP-ribosyltransferase family protein [Nostoc sp. UHCC 0252]
MNNTSHTQLSQLNFYVNADKSFFVRGTKLLNNNLNGIENLLKINNENPVFKIGDTSVIILEPYFDDDGNFYCFPLKLNLQHEDETQEELLKIMYDKWLLKKPKAISISKTRWIQSDTTLVEYSTENIQLVIGFSPQYSVYPNTYALPEEQLPEWVQEWISDDALKIEFLAALGVHTEISNLVKLRIYLENQNEPKFNNLGAISDYPSLCSNTLKWLCEAGVQFRENEKAALSIIRRIYDSVETESNLSWLSIESINDNLITYNLQKTAKTKYYFDEKRYQALSNLEIDLKLILKIIKSQGCLLIDKRCYPDQFNIESAKSIVLALKLDTDLLSKNSINFQEDYYRAWLIKIKNKFSIKLYDGKIPYKLLFENHLVKSIIQNDIDIDTNINIIYINFQLLDSISQLLEQLINKSNFTVDDLNYFKEAKKANKEDIKLELAAKQNTIDTFERPEIEVKCKNDFKDSRPLQELAAFTSKLITSLNQQKSDWRGYIYHFSHIENAVSILKSASILPRGQARFQDSAGKDLIGRTNDDIKNKFSRFYFRPLTPTQWHNELLGSRENISAICPVPIFFCFKIEDVLKTHGARCAVSNGNLATDWARYGNSIEFLDYFDFDNIYNYFGEANYKIASQQEFIVKNGLHFSKDTDFKIICRNMQDEEALINLIGIDSKYVNKIVIDRSFYNDINPFIEVKKSDAVINLSIRQLNDKLITGKIRLFSSHGYIHLKSISSNAQDIIDIQLDKKLIVEAKTNIRLEFEQIPPFSVYFVEDRKNWLIYQYEC